MIRWLSILLIAIFFTACSKENAELRKIPVQINKHVITAKVCDTPESRAQGLMGYTDLPADQGMIFIYDKPDKYAFWMKNMRIPIDMIWIDAEHHVVDIIQNVPACTQDPCPTYMPQEPAQYVLELKAGASKQLQIQPGTLINFTV